MWSVLTILRFIIFVITGVSGTFLNSIIVGLNFRFLRDITISGGYNKILLIIGLINIIFQGVMIFDTICETFHLHVSQRNFFLVTFSLEFTLIGVSTWNTTWLSMFCCARLVNSTHRFFLKIKAMFLRFLPRLIVSSVLFSVAIIFPVYWTTTVDIPQNVTDYPTMSGLRIAVNYRYIICSSLFGFSLPFSMTCVSIGLSVTTLLRHIQRMRRGDSHITSTQLQGHYRAVRTMVMRLILDISFFLITVIGAAVPSFLNSEIYSVFWIIVLTYPTSQAFILIFGNPKLKTAAYGLMKALR